MRRELINVLLRLANKQQNPRQYLEDIVSSKFSTISAQGGAITGTTVNGKSLTLQVLPGTSVQDVMLCAQYALSYMEAGLNYAPSQTYTVLR